MSDNENPRATGEAVAWALCDDEGVFDVEQDEATAKEWVRGGADCGLVRWLRPLVFGDVAHPAPRVGVTGTAEGGDDPKKLLYDLWITWNKLHHESNQVAARIAAIAASTPTRGSDE